MAKINFVFGCVLMLFSLSLKAQNNVVDEVVWIVGDDPILLSEVEENRIAAEMDGMDMKGNPYCVIPEQLAITKLYLHQATLDSIDVSESQILQMVEERMEMWLQAAGSKEKLEEYSRRTISQLRDFVYEQVRNQYITQRVQAKLVEKLKITPAEVRNYFKEMPNDSLPLIPTKVEVQIITQAPLVPRKEIERVENELREYARRVNEGESEFSTLALLYSEDKGSARRGGDLGFTRKGELVPEFANVAFILTDPKKVSKIVRTEYGYHIIQFVERQGDRVRVRHILRKPQVAAQELNETLARMDSIANDIRKGKVTFDNAAAFYSDDKDTRNNRGLMVKVLQRSSTPWFEMQDLPQEVAKTISTMHIGEVSDPFVMVNSKGQEVCAIVKLKSKVDEHRANLTEDFQVLQEVVTGVKQQELLDKWIREKQKTTYIRINDEWKNCEFEYPGWIK